MINESRGVEEKREIERRGKTGEKGIQMIKEGRGGKEERT